jgi:hypothetical protein
MNDVSVVETITEEKQKAVIKKTSVVANLIVTEIKKLFSNELSDSFIQVFDPDVLKANLAQGNWQGSEEVFSNLIHIIKKDFHHTDTTKTIKIFEFSKKK